MATSSQRASLSDHGLFPFRRSLGCAVEVEIPFQHVERAVRICLARLVTDSLGSVTGQGFKSVASTRRAARMLRVAVDPEISSAHRRPGAVGHLHWHARRCRRVFPVMEADLLARPLPGGRTQLRLDATYRPPGGLLGVVGDILFGRVVARSTAEAFTGRLAQTMEDALRDGRCGRWTGALRTGEVA